MRGGLEVGNLLTATAKMLIARVVPTLAVAELPTDVRKNNAATPSRPPVECWDDIAHPHMREWCVEPLPWTARAPDIGDLRHPNLEPVP